MLKKYKYATFKHLYQNYYTGSKTEVIRYLDTEIGKVRYPDKGSDDCRFIHPTTQSKWPRIEADRVLHRWGTTRMAMQTFVE